MQLRQGTLLQGGKFRIERVLGQGGFGITYLAENTMLEGKVAIKEFFLKEYCNRDESTSHVTIPTEGNRELVERFRQKFIKEARTIFKLNHPNIVRILDIFEENGTAYYVMDYIEGESLGDRVKRHGAIPEAEAICYIKEVASALSYIHSEKINHLDIKPGNIMKRQRDGQVFLIDFGVAKQYDAETSEGTTTTPVGISHGYSPAEQYRKNGVQSFSPQSDVYALAATLYKLLTGVTPPEAMEIQDEGLPLDALRFHNISDSTVSSIVNAMKSKSQRTQSVAAFMENLFIDENTHAHAKADVTVIAVEESHQKTPSQPVVKTPSKSVVTSQPAAKSSNSKLWIAVAAFAVVVSMVFVSRLKSSDSDVSPQEEQEAEGRIDMIDYPIMDSQGNLQFHWTGQVTSEGLPYGDGVAKFPANDDQGRQEYQGTLVNGLFEDENATLLYINGSKYEGAFKEGNRTNGTMTLANDGVYYKGSFRQDKEYNGKWYYLDNNDVYSEVVKGKETIK